MSTAYPTRFRAIFGATSRPAAFSCQYHCCILRKCLHELLFRTPLKPNQISDAHRKVYTACVFMWLSVCTSPDLSAGATRVHRHTIWWHAEDCFHISDLRCGILLQFAAQTYSFKYRNSNMMELGSVHSQDAQTDLKLSLAISSISSTVAEDTS